MNGIKLSEIHEHPWFPKTLRDGVTDELQYVFRFGKIYEPVVPRLAKAIQAAGARGVVDLCSGAGGPWSWLRPESGATDEFQADRNLPDG